MKGMCERYIMSFQTHETFGGGLQQAGCSHALKSQAGREVSKAAILKLSRVCQQPFGIHQGKNYNDLMLKIRGSQYILIVKICD